MNTYVKVMKWFTRFVFAAWLLVAYPASLAAAQCGENISVIECLIR